MIIKLSKEELNKIKEDFKNGKVYTDGCFCGIAISNFRDDLYAVLNFSCRKSMFCDNSYYQVTDIYIAEKATNYHSIDRLNTLLKEINNNESDEWIDKIDGREFIIVDDSYSDPKAEDIYLVCEGLKYDEYSLRKIQKRLFKHYKNTYGSYSEAKFKDVGQFIY